MSSVHQVADNQLTLMQNGEEFFPQLCKDIDAAQYYIYLETYRLVDDMIGRMVAESLQRAALRGVEVRVLLDGFGSSELTAEWLEEWRAAGIEMQWFRRELSQFRIRRYRLRRLHRKLVVIDGEAAYIGGINILDDVPANSDLTLPKLDYVVRVQGALVTEVHQSMRHLWGVVSWANLRKRGKHFFAKLAVGQHPIDSSSLAFVVRDNVRHRRDIERAYLQAITNAKKEVIIANAYFLPGRVFRRTLKQAAQRGVRVVLLLQGRVEYVIQHYATRSLYEELLAVGVEVYEYQASYLHAKVAVVDGKWSTVGSSNIDPFSLLLSREANLVVNDVSFAEALRANLLEIIANDVRRVELVKGGYFVPFLSRISYAVIRFLVGIMGFSKWH